MIRYGTALPAQSCASECDNSEAHSFIRLSPFNLFWIFIIASILGLLIETVISAFMDGFIKSRAGLVWGPLSPLYGLGGMMLTITLNRLKGKNPLLIFAVAALAGGALEYVAGWFWESFFGIVAWDYSNYPLHIGTHTCVPMMIVWGAAGLAWVYIGLPLFMKIIGLIPQKVRIPLTVIVATFLAVDVAVTFMAFNCWFDRLSGVPVETPYQIFFETYFGNDWMDNRFQTMSMWTSLAYCR